MTHESIRLEMPCEPINIVPMNPLISKCQIKVCYVGQEPNRNRSIITKEVATQMANSLPGSPIVGYYNDKDGDFEEHNRMMVIEDGKIKLIDETRPYGFVDLGAKCWFQKFLDDGVEHEYLMTEGYLWTGQYPEAQRIIEKGNNQSMELDEERTKAFWTNPDNFKGKFFIINETIISKLCILGEKFEPCFEGAQITKVQFSFDDSFNQKMYSMMEEITQYINKGGEQMDNEITNELIEEVATEVVAEEDVEFKAKKKDEEEEKEDSKQDEEAETENKEEPADGEEEDEEKKKKGKKYNLDEIPEYTDLMNQFSELQASYEQLQKTVETLTSENDVLTEFKKNVDKAKKEEMINSFYMLSDEDKKDVIDNIDNYSLEDIEAKLSVICVRNKVSFSLDEKEEDEEPTTYNLNEVEEDNLTPAWVKAVLQNEKSKK